MLSAKFYTGILRDGGHGGLAWVYSPLTARMEGNGAVDMRYGWGVGAHMVMIYFPKTAATETVKLLFPAHRIMEMTDH